jgi:hypothetical protein
MVQMVFPLRTTGEYLAVMYTPTESLSSRALIPVVIGLRSTNIPIGEYCPSMLEVLPLESTKTLPVGQFVDENASRPKMSPNFPGVCIKPSCKMGSP